MYGQLSTITDPGNAAAAITVGSVHRYRPHTYGITFDSSKGPTLDGRLQTRPGRPRRTHHLRGHRAAGRRRAAADAADAEPTGVARYIEDSGTSMAAAHVSGVIAAFMSARTEFIGHPTDGQEAASPTPPRDLGRHQFFQGAGLIDLMRALSST